jgi:hypothetical protein
MEVLSVLAAKSIWLTNLTELNPKGLRLFPNLSDSLTDMYDFDEQPEDAPIKPGATPDAGIHFRNGQFETDEGFIRVALDVFDDGFVGNTSASTDVTEKFLEHVLNWATSFGLKFNRGLLFNKLFVSEIVVKFSGPVLYKFESLKTFSELLSKNAQNIVQGQEFAPSSLVFAANVGTQQFSIDRRNNTPIGENVFYSKSNMQTSTHVKMLQDFEDLQLMA